MVITFAAHVGVTPAGNPVAAPMPVAPVVVCVILVKTVLMHTVGVLDAVLVVFIGVTVMVTLLLLAELQTPEVTTAR